MTAMKKIPRDELLNAALDRIEQRWPGIDRDAERQLMQSWSDRRLAVAYLPDDTPESYYEEAAAVYGDDDIRRYDSADDGGLAGADPLGQ